MATKGGSNQERVAEAREAFEVVKEISKLLNTGLNDDTLRVCIQLCEAGVNPEALATVIQELRREAAALQVSTTFN
jgi:mitotic-spindle organizing protein 1